MINFKIELVNYEIIIKGIAVITEFYRTIGINELRFSGLNAFVTGINSPFLNVVIDTNERTSHSADVIMTVKDFFKSYHVPWAWFITPIVKNNDLEYLGFSLLEEYPGMYFDLKNSLPNANINSLSIKVVDENDDLSTWIQPIKEGFPSTDHCEGYRKLNANLLQKGESKLRHFIAYHNNQIAAAATLFFGEESVMLHNLATKNSFRKLGIGTALTLHMMKAAQKMEYQHCFLDASEEGFALYQRLGFKIYGTTLAYISNSSLRIP